MQRLIQGLIESNSKNAKIIRKEEEQQDDNRLSDKTVLREVLDDLTHEGNVSSKTEDKNSLLYLSIKVKKLNLLRESLHHKTEVFQTEEINKVKRSFSWLLYTQLLSISRKTKSWLTLALVCTNKVRFWIILSGLKNQRSFLHKVKEIKRKINWHLAASISVNENIKNKTSRTQELLNKKRRLQAILHELKQLAKAKQRISAFKPTINLQEKILS